MKRIRGSLKVVTKSWWKLAGEKVFASRLQGGEFAAILRYKVEVESKTCTQGCCFHWHD